MLAGLVELKPDEAKVLYMTRRGDGPGDLIFAIEFLVENRGPGEIDVSCSNLHGSESIPIASGKERTFGAAASGLGTVSVRAGAKGAKVVFGVLRGA
jgi:hypothetical protein